MIPLAIFLLACAAVYLGAIRSDRHEEVSLAGPVVSHFEAKTSPTALSSS